MSADREKQWEKVQIMGFTAWINSYLTAKGLAVENLQTDFQNGVRLCTFCEIIKDRIPDLNKVKLQRWERNPNIRLHYIENTNSAFKFIKDDLKVKLVAIGAEDIVDGNIKYILGLLWSVFRKLRDSQLGVEGEGQGAEQQALLQWVKKMTEGYKGVEIKGFKDSWHDGLALNALVHRFDPTLLDYDSINPGNKEANLQQAFVLAEKHLGIPQLLEAEDLMKCNPDERSVVFYISLFFHAFVADAERRAIIEARTKTEKGLSDLQARLDAEIAERKRLEEDREALKRRIRELEEENARLKKELADAKDRLRLEQLLRADEKGYLEEKIQALQQLLDSESGQSKESEERARRLRKELEDAFRAREELEELRKKLEAEGSDLLQLLRDAEDAKKRLRAELEELRKKVEQQLERAKRKARAALELERENNALKRAALVQGKARFGLDVLKKNLEEHLEDMYKWRELHQLDQDAAQAPDVFDLQKVVDELQKKNFEEQLDVLNSKLQAENRNLQRIIRMKDIQKEIADTVDKQGWLEMKGIGKQKEWKKQWFVLRGANLQFYKSDDSDRQAGVIPLDNAEIVHANPEDDHKYVIGIKVEDKNITLAATSKKEKDEWKAVLNGEVIHLKYLASIEKDPKKRPDTRVINLFKSVSIPSVYLDGHDIHTEEIEALSKVLGAHSDLETFSVNNANLGDSEVSLLAKYLAKLNFKILKLGGNKITSKGASALAGALASHKYVTEVHLNDNQIDDAGAEALSALLGNKEGKLTAINLTGNKIGDKGASAFAKALASGLPLRDLYFGKNVIGNEGAAAFASIISGKDTVAHVFLNDNKIGDNGAVALADALKANDSVTEVDLSNNEFGNTGAVAVKAALKASKSLNSVNISGNKLSGGAALSGLLDDGFNFPALSFVRTNPV